MPAHHLANGIAIVFAALALSGCMVLNPFERQSAKNRWTAAIVNEDYVGAGRLLTGPSVATWETEARQLRQAHGKVRSLNLADVISQRGEPPFTSIRVTWADGYERCLRLRRVADDRHLDLLDGGWQDCANVPFNPTPPPGP